MDVSLRQLEVFVTVARVGTVTAAASELGMTQSAASSSLAELERILGVRLFDRVGRRLVLSSAGEGARAEAERTLASAAGFVSAASGSADAIAGPARVAASTTIGSYVLAPMVAPVLRRHPGIELSLRIGSTDTVVGWVASRVVDFGVVEGPFAARGVVRQPWVEDEIVVVAAPELASSIARDPSRLADAVWLVREPGSGTRVVAEAALADAGTPMRRTIEIGGTEALKRFAEQGVGLCAMSNRAVQAELGSGQLALVDVGTRITRTFSLVLSSSGAIGEPAHAVLDELRRQGPPEISES